MSMWILPQRRQKSMSSLAALGGKAKGDLFTFLFSPFRLWEISFAAAAALSEFDPTSWILEKDISLQLPSRQSKRRTKFRNQTGGFTLISSGKVVHVTDGSVQVETLWEKFSHVILQIYLSTSEQSNASLSQLDKTSQNLKFLSWGNQFERLSIVRVSVPLATGE